MKIEELHIYGFGKLENLVLSNLDDFQVFYGENEAGKTTIMAFIHAVLFGFPTKQQQELRYEPKGGGRYGGRVSIRHPQYGFAVIERVKGKAAGDVTVMLENGASGNEELLKKLLGNFDRSMFQAVFSFNLHGLQNIHQMKNEEIGRFLFSSGTLGTDRLARAESMLQKDLEARYKPSGKKPALNSKLAGLRSLDADLKKAAEKNNGYEALVAERESLQQNIESLRQAVLDLSEKSASLKEWEKVEELAREEVLLDAEIKESKEIRFPARGIERLESCKQLLRPFLSQLEMMRGKRQALAEELAGLGINDELLGREPEVGAVLEGLHAYGQSGLELNQLEEKTRMIEDKIMEMRRKLHLEVSDDEIHSIKTDMFTKKQAETADEMRKRIEGQKHELEASFNEEKIRLEQLEAELIEARQRLLKQEERADLEKASRTGNAAEIKARLEDCRDRIAILERSAKLEEESRRKSRPLGLLGALISLCLIVYGLYGQDWILSGLGILMVIFSASIVWKASGNREAGEKAGELEQQRKKEKELDERLSAFQSGGNSSAALKLEHDDRQRLKVNSLEGMLEQQNHQYEKVLAKFERLEQDEAQWKKLVEELCGQLRIADPIGANMPVEAFLLIEECKSLIAEKARLSGNIISLKERMAGFEEAISSLSKFIPGIPENEVRLACHYAKTALEEAKRKVVIRSEKTAALEELEYDLKKVEKERSSYEQEMSELFAQADADNEEAYYLLGEEARKQEELRDRLKEVKRELALSRLDREEREGLLSVRNVHEHIEETARQLVETERRLEEARNRLSEVRYEIQVLEEGGTYSEILHNFRQAQSDFAEEAKEWAVHMLAKELLNRTVNRFKDYHLPRLLKKAGEYLEFLTGGNYSKLFVAPSGTGFVIQRADHVRFEADELSQATMEQVYVSLRLALAETIYGKLSFPLIIDDSFVNFDGERARRMIELLKKAEGRQILFFTCHEHLLGHFDENQIYQMGRKPAKIRG
ncbi:ATP-binding protein [Bacillus sp. B-jedd]|uniref:ATP-binding protein n=1 Tax=Bacillus sp. B-jedd TaxID=1476857 RepID=UPI0005155E1D|nr:AAA family ATPase [Bacillus sp. B-jedd]CEG29644.1 P-loop containing nucleoside triphosphate hydrolase [Bacillus sp. B-jedd]